MTVPPPTAAAGPPPTAAAGPPPTAAAGPPPTAAAGPPPTAAEHDYAAAGPHPTAAAGPHPTALKHPALPMDMLQLYSETRFFFIRLKFLNNELLVVEKSMKRQYITHINKFT